MVCGSMVSAPGLSSVNCTKLREASGILSFVLESISVPTCALSVCKFWHRIDNFHNLVYTFQPEFEVEAGDLIEHQRDRGLFRLSEIQSRLPSFRRCQPACAED